MEICYYIVGTLFLGVLITIHLVTRVEETNNITQTAAVVYSEQGVLSSSIYDPFSIFIFSSPSL